MKQLQVGVTYQKSSSGFSNLIITLDKASYRFNKLMHFVGCVLLFIMMFLTTVDVIGRYFFNNPVIGATELMRLFLVVVVFFGIGYTQSHKEHLEIDVFTNNLPQKAQLILSLITYLVLTLVIALLSVQLFRHGINMYLGNEVSGDLEIPLYYFAVAAAIGSLSFAITYFIDTLKTIEKLVKR